MADFSQDKIKVAGIAIPTFLLLGLGVFAALKLYRMLTEGGGAGEAADEREEAAPLAKTPKECLNAENLRRVPAGCGTIPIKGYEKGKEQQITISELPGYPGFYLQKSPIDAYSAFMRLLAAARKDGVVIEINSSFRTMKRQQELYDENCNAVGICKPITARPGRSNHQYGTALDLQVKTNPKLYKWLKANALRFGFIDDAKPNTPQYEPWHWHYRPELDQVGRGLAGMSPLMVATVFPFVPPL